MSQYLGDFAEDATIPIFWSTNAQDGGESAASAAFTTADIGIYKDAGLTQKTSTNGLTVDDAFDGITGVHHLLIDTSNDTGDAGFWVTGSDYVVILNTAKTIDSQTVKAILAEFSIEARFNEVDVTKWLGTAAATPTTAGVPEVDVTHWIGTAAATPTVAGVPEVDLTHMEGGTQSVTDLKDFADAGYDPATNKVQGVVLVDTTTTNTDMAGTDSAALASVCTEARLAELDAANLPTDIAAIPTTAMRGTDSAALASVCTEPRLAELDAANLPTDIAAIPTTAMRGTDSAALASVCTEGRLAELDAANLPTDVAAIPTTAMRGTDSAATAANLAIVDTVVDAILVDTGTTIPATLGTPADTDLATDILNAPQAVWDKATALLVTVGSVGELLVNNVTGSTADVLARLGAFTTGGVNTVLGFFQALMRSDATTPSDVGGTYDDATDSTQAIADSISAGTTKRQVIGSISGSGVNCYIQFHLLVDGILAANGTLTTPVVTDVYDLDGTSLAWSATDGPTVVAPGLVHATGTVTAPTLNQPVFAKVQITHGGSARDGALRGIVLAV